MNRSFFVFSRSVSRGIVMLSLLVGSCATIGCGEVRLSANPSGRVNQVAKKRPDKTFRAVREIAFVENHREGREIAKELNKPLLLFFYLPDCVYSQKMLDDTFRDEEVAALAERFVCVKINVTREKKLCKDLEINSTPTIQFMTPQGTLLQRHSGKTPNQLLVQMQVAIQSTAASVASRNR